MRLGLGGAALKHCTDQKLIAEGGIPDLGSIAGPLLDRMNPTAGHQP
jgi:hypothetical protein